MRTPIPHRRLKLTRDLESSVGIDKMMILLSEMDGREENLSAMAPTFCPTTKDVKVLGPEEDYLDCNEEMGDDMTDKKLWGPCLTMRDLRWILGPDVYCRKTRNGNIMMDEKLWGSLPQALLEELLARVPFKLLFQCRVLSRGWRWNGRGGRSTNPKKQQTSQFFEKAISSVSSRWPTYCPVHLFKDGLVGYNSESQAWEKSFDLEMFECGILEGINMTVTSCAGALVCFASDKPSDNEIYVANVVTRKWKRLPPRPIMQRPNIMYLIPVGSTDYKVILLTQLEPKEELSCVSKTTIVTQIYHSLSNSWTQKSSKVFLPRWRTSLYNFVYLDGVFYIATAGSSPIYPPLLHVHNVEKGTWDTRVAPVQQRQLVKCYVLLCGPEVILVAEVLDEGPVGSEETLGDVSGYRNMFVRAHNFLIFKLDLATSHMKEVSRCDREKLGGVAIDQVLAYGDTIYFGGKYIAKTAMMMYNVRKQEWTYQNSDWEMPESNFPSFKGLFHIEINPKHYNWAPSALQPGLNPFAEV